MADTEFNEPGRAELIEQIAEILFIDRSKPYSSAAWALLWLADLSRLQQLKTDLNEFSVRRDFATLIQDIIKPWKSKNTDKMPGQNKDEPGTPSESACDTPTGTSSNKKRTAPEAPQEDTPQGNTQEKKRKLCDSKLKALSSDRDVYCVITKIANKAVLQNCYIYPNSLGPTGQNASFWDRLNLFWAEEKVEQWRSVLNSAQGTEVLANVITMNVLAHTAWDACFFALKHISSTADGFEMKLTFHWLRPRNKVEKTLPLDQFKIQPSFSSGDECGEGFLFLYDVQTHEPIKSGHIITLTTDDPIERPLPSKLLIDLQWHLHRIAALTAAAIDDELELGDDDDDDDFDERPLLANSET